MCAGVAWALLCACAARADDSFAGLDAPAQSLLIAAHTNVIPLSQTVEQLNGAPASLDDSAVLGDAAITGALGGNDVFGVAASGQSGGTATALSDLAGAEALGRTAIAATAGPLTTDNSLPEAGARRMIAPPEELGDALSADGVPAEPAPENAPDGGPVTLAAHGGAINAATVE